MPKKQNIFQLPANLPLSTDTELFEKIIDNGQILIERIISTGQITPTNEWYEQEKDEWVVLLQGSAQLLFDNEQGNIVNLTVGDYIFIPAFRKHRVTFTSITPPCIWLAIHGTMNE